MIWVPCGVGLEKEMATHSSVLAWRIPGTGEPGGLPSMGMHRVGQYWRDLAAAGALATPVPTGWAHEHSGHSDRGGIWDWFQHPTSQGCSSNCLHWLSNLPTMETEADPSGRRHFSRQRGGGKLITLCVLSCFLLCLTPCDPTDCSPPGSSVHGILQTRILEWVAVPSSRGSSQPRDGTCIFLSLPAFAAGFFTTRPIWEAPVCVCMCMYICI